MKQFAILLIALVLLPEGGFGQSLPQAPLPAAPVDDDASWNRLSMLDPGSQVSVTPMGHWPIRCQYLHVDDRELSCQSGGMFPRSFDLRRSDVEQVALRHERRNFWIGVGAMSALGFALGASKPDIGPYEPRAVGGLIGAGLLGFASSPFVFAAVHWIPGKTIYRQPLRHTQAGH